MLKMIKKNSFTSAPTPVTPSTVRFVLLRLSYLPITMEMMPYFLLNFLNSGCFAKRISAFVSLLFIAGRNFSFMAQKSLSHFRCVKDIYCYSNKGEDVRNKEKVERIW